MLVFEGPADPGGSFLLFFFSLKMLAFEGPADPGGSDNYN